MGDSEVVETEVEAWQLRIWELADFLRERPGEMVPAHLVRGALQGLSCTSEEVVRRLGVVDEELSEFQDAEAV